MYAAAPLPRHILEFKLTISSGKNSISNSTCKGERREEKQNWTAKKTSRKSCKTWVPSNRKNVEGNCWNHITKLCCLNEIQLEYFDKHGSFWLYIIALLVFVLRRWIYDELSPLPFSTPLRWKHIGGIILIEVCCQITWRPSLFPIGSFDELLISIGSLIYFVWDRNMSEWILETF